MKRGKNNAADYTDYADFEYAAAAMHLIDWQPEMTSATVDLLARAFANNPVHLAAFGGDSVVERNRAFFRTALSVLGGRRLVATDGTRILAFMHWVESPRCQLSVGQRIRLAPAMMKEFGPRSALRVGAWLSSWAKNDCRDPHVHFGPVGVDPAFQGSGIGREMMEFFCTNLNDSAMPGFLETDKPENVRFYQKFGFEVVKETDVIGARTFFMTRSTGKS